MTEDCETSYLRSMDTSLSKQENQEFLRRNRLKSYLVVPCKSLNCYKVWEKEALREN